MTKDIFPIISDETAVELWRKQLLVATITASICGAILVAVIAVIVCPQILDDGGELADLILGALIVGCVTSAVSFYINQRVISAARFRMQSARRFMQDAGHELATPVAILGSRLQVMERELQLDETGRDHLTTLLDSTNRLSVLVDDMRALAKAEAPKDASNLSLLNLSEVVASTCAQLKEVCESRAMTIETVLMPATVIGEQQGIERVVRNLVSNAVNYGRDGGAISISVQSTQSAVILTIEDDGIGIAADDLPKIFDRFYRGDPSRSNKTPGSGLGLAIVKAVVERHSGKIFAESELGKFTRFTLEFPKSPVHPIMQMMNTKT